MGERILRTQHVCKKLNISATSLWRYRKSGVFPDPCKIEGSSVCGWRESVVDEWISKNFTSSMELEK